MEEDAGVVHPGDAVVYGIDNGGDAEAPGIGVVQAGKVEADDLSHGQ